MRKAAKGFAKATGKVAGKRGPESLPSKTSMMDMDRIRPKSVALAMGLLKAHYK